MKAHAISLAALLLACQGSGRPAPSPRLPAAAHRSRCAALEGPRPDRDSAPMCRVEGGSFLMGRGTDARRVEVDTFAMDEHEVTVAQYTTFLTRTQRIEEVGCRATRDWECVPVAFDDGRVAYVWTASWLHARDAALVSWHEAREYCAWAGKVMPTNEEWEYAARHDPVTGRDYLFPWGDEFDGTRTRCFGFCGRDSPPRRVEWFDGSGFRDEPLQHLGAGDGRSPWGIHDMAGNPEEWVDECYQDDCRSAWRGTAGAILDPGPAPYPVGLGYLTFRHGEYAELAFRCAWRPEPAP